jgi:hypothetical protein
MLQGMGAIPFGLKCCTSLFRRENWPHFARLLLNQIPHLPECIFACMAKGGRLLNNNEQIGCGVIPINLLKVQSHPHWNMLVSSAISDLYTRMAASFRNWTLQRA